MAHRTSGTCSVAGCRRPTRSVNLEWCESHRRLWRLYGQLTPRTQIDRFWSHVEKTDGCWLWTGSRSEGGYGRTMRQRPGGSVYAHRVAYELLVGIVPDHLHLDHLCRNRACCNPAHLEPVTPRENARRGETGIRNRIKTHCPQGHAYNEKNTYYGTGGARTCRTCQTIQFRRSRLK